MEGTGGLAAALFAKKEKKEEEEEKEGEVKEEVGVEEELKKVGCALTSARRRKNSPTRFFPFSPATKR